MQEGLIAVLLIGFVSLPLGMLVMCGGFSIYEKFQTVPVWLHISFFLLFWLGLYNGGVINGWGMTDIVRDAIPCLYLFLPILLLPVMRKSNLDWLRILPWVLAAVGVILSIRFFMTIHASPLDVGKMHFFDNFLYLPYDPSVVFASIFLPIMAIHTWRSRPLHWGLSLLMVVGGLVALSSLMAVAQRAPIALTFLCYVVYCIAISRKSFAKLLLLVLVWAGILYFAQDQISGSYGLLAEKQQEFGSNGKLDELHSVLRETSHSGFAMLFGMGWGGLFSDPAVKGVRVSYTHSAVTFFLLKAGIVGLSLFLLYIAWVVYRALRFFRSGHLPLMLSLTVPLIIGLLFQVSYKTLTFGIILTMFCLFAESRRQAYGQNQSTTWGREYA